MVVIDMINKIYKCTVGTIGYCIYEKTNRITQVDNCGDSAS